MTTKQDLLRSSIIIDGQLGFEESMPWSFKDKWDLVNQYKDSGFTAITLSVANEENSFEEAISYLAQIRSYVASNADKYVIATTQEDILKAKAENKIALRLMFQGTNPIGKKLELLETFKQLGVSSMLIAYNIQTPIGSGVIEQQDNGLSFLGQNFISEMNKLDLILDGSHAGYETSMDALKLSQKPMVFSHSGVYGVAPHVRNIKDEQILALAKNGGVIGINGLGLLLGDANAGIDKYVQHIDYVKKLVGIRHISIGLDNLYFADQFADFMQQQKVSHPSAYSSQVMDATTWKYIKPQNITDIIEALLDNSYTELEIQAILGQNILRIMK